MLDNLNDWKSTLIFFIVGVLYAVAEAVLAAQGGEPINWERTLTVAIASTVLGLFSTFKSFKKATPTRGPPGA